MAESSLRTSSICAALGEMLFGSTLQGMAERAGGAATSSTWADMVTMGAFEPTFIERRDGTLWMLIRTNWDRFWEAISYDEGLSWRTILPSSIEASTSPGYLTRLQSGRILLAWNCLHPEGADGYPRRSGQLSEDEASWHREELSVSLSEDEGVSWSTPRVVAREKDAWISYPYVFEHAPGQLWILTGQGDLQLRVAERDLLDS